MDAFLGVVLIILPIVLAFVLLMAFHKAADTTGVIVWAVTVAIAVLAFSTDLGIALVASVAGIVKSFPISLMVATSILMMTYMQETKALPRLIVFFKTLGGGSRPLQIMLISLGLGLFLVGIGATPVSMLPPVMLALGFSPLVAVALPAIGYDPLTTFALLGVPAVVFGDIYQTLDPSVQLWQAGSVFAMYMPIITTGIALSMLWIAGGKDLLFDREAGILAILCGLTAGGVAILANTALVNQTTLTNVFAGAAVILVLSVYTKARGRPMIDRSVLTEDDLALKSEMSLGRASIPWVILVVLCLVTNVIPPIKDLLFIQLTFPVTIGPYPGTILTRFLWQAYTLMLVSTLISMPFLGVKNGVFRRTLKSFSKRAPRPVLAAAIFFAMAEVMKFSGFVTDPSGTWLSPLDPINMLDPTNNMVYLLAQVTSSALGPLYPLTAAFIGLMAGFVSGSETSAIAMFTDYHFQASTAIGLTGTNAMVVSASNGIGGGLASVLSPAKIQNAAAVIDEIGIEGQVIRYGAVVAILMTFVTAVLTFFWAFWL
ncbi:MAG: L-lactate permease [Candidatus Thorarchaeota archaeon]